MPAKQTAKKVARSSATRKGAANSKSPSMDQIKEEEETKKAFEKDDDFNSGFGNYLKSGEGNLSLDRVRSIRLIR